MKLNQSQVALSLDPTRILAQRVVDTLHSITHSTFEVHDIEENSFELAQDREKFAGGSFYVNSCKFLILASTTPQTLLGSVDRYEEIEESLFILFG